MEQDKQSVLLKKAKRAVFWGIVLNRSIPEKYHCMMVNLECCSMRQLKFYIRDNQLSKQAETLLAQKYADSDSKLVAFYVSQHFDGISGSMQIELIKSHNIALFQNIAASCSGYIRHFELKNAAIVALIKLDDAVYFSETAKCDIFPKSFERDTVTALIEQQNADIFEAYLQMIETQRTEFWNLHQKMLYTQNNEAMIDCFLKHQTFDANIVCEIIEQENTALFGKLIEKRKLADTVECFLAESGSKKMIAQYLRQWPLHPKAQIELVKRDCKDLLKLHYLKHSISDQALLYVLGLNNFKQYLGI